MLRKSVVTVGKGYVINVCTAWLWCPCDCFGCVTVFTVYKWKLLGDILVAFGFYITINVRPVMTTQNRYFDKKLKPDVSICGEMFLTRWNLRQKMMEECSLWILGEPAYCNLTSRQAVFLSDFDMVMSWEANNMAAEG